MELTREQKIGEATRKRWQDPEYRKKASQRMSGSNNPFYGKKHTKETIEYIIKIGTGRKNSEESKQKVREWCKNNPEKLSYWKGKKQPKEMVEKRILKGDKCYQWKGDEVGYRTLHKWVEKQLGQPRFCEDCGNRDLKHRQYHWANISRNYKRIITDWRRLCVKCHKAYDRASL